MKSETAVGIGMLLPALLILATLVTTTNYLVKDIQQMNGGLITYANCAQNMMNYAFLGQVYNFTQCYLQQVNQTQLNCYYNSTNIVCNVNGTSYVYPLN
ncbi:hypothetical protein YN1_1770 [Nanoarchaeota archaeon]